MCSSYCYCAEAALILITDKEAIEHSQILCIASNEFGMQTLTDSDGWRSTHAFHDSGDFNWSDR